MKQIKIYTSPTCTHCQELKSWLDSKKLEYSEYNVFADEDARDFIIKKSEQMSVPVTLIIDDQGRENIIAGFDETAIEEALSKK